MTEAPLRSSSVAFRRFAAPGARAVGAILVAAALLPAVSCASFSGETVARERFLMGTQCRVQGPVETLSAEQIDAAFNEIARIESFLSTWKPESELSALNRAAESQPMPVQPELAALLAEALRWSGETGGAFNPLVGPLIELWHTRDEGAVPTDVAILSALTRTSTSLVSVDLEHSTVTRSGGAAFEEGAFGKGYALDRAVDVLRAAGSQRALIDFGGQIAVFGFEEGLEVAIASPEDRQSAALMVVLTDGSVSTSSGSEQTFEVEGVRFSHLIDPRNGRALPARGSVTVIHSNALVADILSTALYVLGPEEGMKWANDHQVAALFLVPSGKKYQLIKSGTVKYNMKVNREWVTE